MAPPADPPAAGSPAAAAPGGPAAGGATRAAQTGRSGAPRLRDPNGAVPRLGEPAVLAVLAVALALQLFSWNRLHGYQLADSVEFMERARGVLLGHEVLGPSSVRSFAFSALFLPAFWLVDLLGIEDARFLVPVFRLGMMAFGLALVLACMRLGARIGGRSAGLAAGWLAAANPVLLQYTVSPISGIAAGLFIALGLEHLLEPRTRRHHFAGGLCLGLAFLLAYQTLLISFPVLVLVALRDRGARPTLFVRGAVAGFVVALAAQVVLDRVSYGRWGASIGRYVAVNAGAVIVRVLWDYLGWEAGARAVYAWVEPFHGVQHVEPGLVGDLGAIDLQDKSWYFANLERMLPWPVIVLVGAGLLIAVLRPRWSTTLLAGVLVLNVLVMGHKGSKSFRLWLPLIPLLFPLAGVAYARLAGERGAPLRAARAATGVLVLAAATALGIMTLRANEARRFGVYWDAMAWLNAELESERDRGTLVPPDDAPVPSGGFGEGKLRVSSTYHWAVFLRESPLVNLVKLPFDVDGWDGYDEAVRARIVGTLRTLDRLLVHLPAITTHPELMRVVNEEFEVEAAFFSSEAAREIGPVFVLRRRSPFEDTTRSDARRFFTLFEASSFGDASAPGGLALPPRVRRSGARLAWIPADGAREELEFAGWRYEPLPGSHLGWLSCWWRPLTPVSTEWTLADRFTNPDERVAWEDNHHPAYGCLESDVLAPGTLLREGFLVVAGSDPFSRERPFRHFGGPYRRADLIPTSLWLACLQFDDEGERLRAMVPVDGSGRPRGLEPGGAPGPDGARLSPDEALLVDEFLMAVHPAAAIPDDGGPDPDDDLSTPAEAP